MTSLYVVATPIGNLQDVTLRALEVLRAADVLAAEDTRVSARLLAHYGIGGKPLLALHEHNERQAAQRVLEHLQAGRSVALISDAGTPAVSDPGALTVRAARDAGFAVVPVPGPSALAAALSVAALGPAPFLFCGFLPPKAAARRRALDALAPLPHALVFYEAPHRIVESLADMAGALGGEREVVICRELTKLFESVHACPLQQAADWVGAEPDRQKGEFVLVVHPPAAPRAEEGDALRVLKLLLEELPVSRAADLAARITGTPRKALYSAALALREAAPDE